MTGIPAVRPPSAWADAQREFTAATMAGRAASAMTDVTAVVVDNPETWLPERGGGALVPSVIIEGVCALIRRRRRGPAGAYVVLWPRSAQAGEEASLVVPVEQNDLPALDGPVEAVVWGEFAPNGALAIAVDGRLIFPSYNPQAPWGALGKLRGPVPK